MHILFIHQNFPAQFGQIAVQLIRRGGYRCTFLTQHPPAVIDGIERIPYTVAGGATEHNHFSTRTFENAVRHSHGIYEALAARPDLKPDLVVAHSGFLSTVLLRELYDCPIVNYFEYYYHTRGTDMDYRPEFPHSLPARLRARIRNAHLLLDLEECDVGYSPTRWQRSLFPATYRHKIRTIFDGIDTSFWQPRPGLKRQIGDWLVPDSTKIVTYVSRGLESIRGFDIFMKIAKRLCDKRKDVVFVIAGEDRVCYGGDSDFTGGLTFKQWVLSQDKYDLSRFTFSGLLPPLQLANLFSISDLHIYLTVPFVLSWSLMNALACGTTVLASDTPPVREMIRHEENGLLADFFDIDEMVKQAERVLDAPSDFRRLGRNGLEMVRRKYSLEASLPQMVQLFDDAVHERSRTSRRC